MSKKIFVGENRISKLSNLITENWADTKRTIVRKTLNVIKNIFPEASDEELMNMEKEVMRKYFHGRLASDPKFRPIEPTLAKILYGELDFQKTFTKDEYGLFILRMVLRNIKTLAKNKIKPPITIDDTLETLVEKFGTKTEDLVKFGIDITKNEISNTGDYDVIEIDSFDEANEYGNLSNPNGKLCYTQDEETWEEYTEGGENTCYLFLKDGYEHEKPIEGENCPYDDYGLSMIWVFLSPDGEIKCSNTRWNHNNEENLPPGRETDYSFDKSEIEEITGYNVDSLYSDDNTNTPENLLKKYEFNKRIESGMGFEEACKGIVDKIEKFGEIYIVDIGALSTFVKNGKILYPNLWCTTLPNKESNEFQTIYSKGFENVIFSNGRLLGGDSESWFKYIKKIKEYDAFIVANKGGFNVYDFNGNKFFEHDINIIKPFFYDGYKQMPGIILIDYSQDEWYLYSLKLNDVILKDPSTSPIYNINGSNWFVYTDENKLKDLFDINGKRRYGKGIFSYISSCFENGLLVVEIGNKYNLININGDIILGQDSKVDSYTLKAFGNFGMLGKINGEETVIDKNGFKYSLSDFLNNMVFSNGAYYNLSDFKGLNIERINNNYYTVSLKISYDYIKAFAKSTLNGIHIISNNWFKDINLISDSLFVCKLDTFGSPYMLMNPDGEFLFEKPAKEITKWGNNFLIVKFRDEDDNMSYSYRYNENYALVDIRTNQIIHKDIKEAPKLFDGEDSKPKPIKFKGFMNYITPEGTLLNGMKYTHVDEFYNKDWARVYTRNWNNVVFLDGTMLSDEGYKNVLGGNGKLFAVVKLNEEEDVYIVSRDGKVDTKYTYDMFPYLYHEGFGKIFGDFENEMDNKLKPFNMIKVWIKRNPSDDSYMKKNDHVGCNIIDLGTNEFIFPRFYDYISTKDGKIFEVANWDEYYDIIDINSNSLLGGRKPTRIDADYSPIGSYEIVFNENGNEYMEFYDENFNLIKRMTEEELKEWERKNYGA